MKRKAIDPYFHQLFYTIRKISYLKHRMRGDHSTAYLPILYNNDLNPFTVYNEDAFYSTTSYLIQ
jgi:hypothetical protein